MPFVVPMATAQVNFPEYTFVAALTPSEQKCAFHVRDREGEDLCLKIIAPNYSIDRLEREITALQAIDHKNVVRLIEYTFSSRPGHQRHFLVEEFIGGQDLSACLGPSNVWSREATADFFAQLCDGLAELQRHSFVHRDLKPNNIRIRPDGSPVIIDFGLARLLNMTDLTHTAQGAAIGTPLYFAPEQFAGTKYDIDHRTDLFALGVLMYHALFGCHPFSAGAGVPYDQLMRAVCTNADCTSAPDYLALPSHWKLILGRLLEKDRVRRPQNAAQVANVLRKIRGL